MFSGKSFVCNISIIYSFISWWYFGSLSDSILLMELLLIMRY